MTKEELRAARNKRYRTSKKGKAWRSSEKGKAADARYYFSDKGQVTNAWKAERKLHG
jgi:hypothetical protein